jgi:hypothetical protein
MKHKLKTMVALIGTALLGNHSVSANLVESASSETGYHGSNDSFVSKLATSESESIYNKVGFTEEFSSSPDSSKGDSKEEQSIINDEASTTTCSGGGTGTSGKGGGGDTSGSYGKAWFNLPVPNTFTVEHYETAVLKSKS